MKPITYFQIKHCKSRVLILICLLFFVSCTDGASTVSEELPDTTSNELRETSTSEPMATKVSPTVTVTKDTIITNPATEVVTPEHISASPTPIEQTFIDQRGFLEGPLVGFRGYDSQGDFVLILDLGNDSSRIVREEVDHPFGRLWFNNGCQIHTSSGLVDLFGNMVWQKPNLDWKVLLAREGAYNKVGLLSPNRQWLAYDILYGEQFFEDSEFADIGIVNLTNPAEHLILTNDGRAHKFAWSPDSEWLAYKHVDENGMPQLFRTSPDGRKQEQLTSHLERLGIGYIIWSPDGRYIAYAAYKSEDEGESGKGWIEIVDTETLNSYRIQPNAYNFGGVRDDSIWWSLDGEQLVFSGRDWQDSANNAQIYWVDFAQKSIKDSFYASDIPEGAIEEVYAVGSVEQILFRANNSYYLLNVADKKYEPISFDLGSVGQLIESESAPFDFPGEEKCN
ncbi:MAG: PD40 domain-containing protein [Anaerolineales bacterium]|nr:PD40 domain-containing protein [Anaerolineales bacterium]